MTKSNPKPAPKGGKPRTPKATAHGDIAPATKAAKESILARTVARAEQATIAIKLGKTYEFSGGAVDLKMIAEEPIAHHSWTMEHVQAPADTHVKRFIVGNDVIDLPIGVTVVLGMSGTGKTLFVFGHLFGGMIERGDFSARYYRVFEPAKPNEIENNDLVLTPQFEAEFAANFASDLLDSSVDMILVDSLRYLFYTATGATGKGGVNMGLFADLTSLDNVATRLGTRVLVVLNPLTDDPTSFSLYQEAARGAVAGLIVMKSFDRLEFSSRYAATRDLRPINLGRPRAIHTQKDLVTIAMKAGKVGDIAPQIKG